MSYLIKRLYFLILMPGFIVGLVASKTSQHREPEVQPNVVVILTDDQGWGDLSFHGNTNLNTPNIDMLAGNGTSFERFYVCPVCSPTRAELLTGRYHPRMGVYSTSEGGERMDPDETTIADVFKASGYATAAFGKWHNGMQYPYHPNARGFDEYYGFCSGHWGHYFSPMLEHNGKLVTGNGFIIDDLTDHAIDFIDKSRDNPFFLYIPYNTPHGPMQVPDIYWDRFKDAPLLMRHRDPEKEDVMFTRAALAMCENIDYNVGRILDKLVETGLEDNTIVVFLCDNGPNSSRWNNGMKGRKGSTDEGGVRSPLFIRWKGVIEEGKEIQEIAAAIDLLPTLAELAGIALEGTRPLDGISLKPLILVGDSPDPDRIIFSHWAGRVSARSQQYRLDHEGQLFNMVDDPGQYNNIAEKQPEIAQRLLEARDIWEQSVLAELPEKDERPFPLGHPGSRYTQIPARDGVAHGNIVRSNRWPNCSYFTNWTSTDDRITWDVEVTESGDFEVTLYYTCPQEDIGSAFELSFNESSVRGEISEAHDPPLVGMEEDRVERHNSYVKDFKPIKLPVMHLEKGAGELTLQALNVPGSQVMDFRLLMFERID
ncbi:MAG: N-acetylgalactosamine 6-sulfate sulfatase [Bacteroides sp. SM23_62]|nr:MAG: N-acetylgalactosamine 6-sulfate sulfatase [Bacteroides sp. SM23_62]